ncbi:MAG TPA: DUF4304 domain-containing protein [Methylotenera sp.]
MKEIEAIISSVVLCDGFKKKGKNWWLQVNDVLQVINLQKSQYGNQFYINFGIYLGNVTGDEKVKINLCHIQFRLESILSANDRILIKQVLDLDNLMPEIERARELSLLMRRGSRKNGEIKLQVCDSSESLSR